MAQNSASHNPSTSSCLVTHRRIFVEANLSVRTVGESTAPLTEKPPQADEETRNQIVDAAAKDPTGRTQGGQDCAGPKAKSEKECR